MKIITTTNHQMGHLNMYFLSNSSYDHLITLGYHRSISLHSFSVFICKLMLKQRVLRITKNRYNKIDDLADMFYSTLGITITPKNHTYTFDEAADTIIHDDYLVEDSPQLTMLMLNSDHPIDVQSIYD